MDLHLLLTGRAHGGGQLCFQLFFVEILIEELAYFMELVSVTLATTRLKKQLLHIREGFESFLVESASDAGYSQVKSLELHPAILLLW